MVQKVWADLAPSVAPLLEVQNTSVRSCFEEEEQRFPLKKELDESIGY